jgi:hypothetical protein
MLRVGQDVRDVGDVVEKFTGDPRGAGVTSPHRGVIVEGGAPVYDRSDPGQGATRSRVL